MTNRTHLTFRNVAFVAWTVLALAAPGAATAQSNIERQAIEAILSFDYQKARDVIELGNVDVNNIAGKPIIAYLATTYRTGNTGRIDVDYLKFVVDELKQNPNAMLTGDLRTFFSTFCESLIDFDRLPAEYARNGVDPRAVPDAILRANFDDNFLKKLNFLLERGGSSRDLPFSENDFKRAFNPLPSCILSLREFLRIYGDRAGIKQAMFEVFDRLIAKGADPRLSFPVMNQHDFFNGIYLAAEFLDVDILTYFTGKGVGANFHVLNREKVITKNAVSYLPAPKDADTERARAFLAAWVAKGGNITQSQFVPHSGSRYTLKDRALGFGHVEYARMVQDIERMAAAAKPPTPSQPAAPSPAPAQPASAPAAAEAVEACRRNLGAAPPDLKLGEVDAYCQCMGQQAAAAAGRDAAAQQQGCVARIRNQAQVPSPTPAAQAAVAAPAPAETRPAPGAAKGTPAASAWTLARNRAGAPLAFVKVDGSASVKALAMYCRSRDSIGLRAVFAPGTSAPQIEFTIGGWGLVGKLDRDGLLAQKSWAEFVTDWTDADKAIPAEVRRSADYDPTIEIRAGSERPARINLDGLNEARATLRQQCAQGPGAGGGEFRVDGLPGFDASFDPRPQPAAAVGAPATQPKTEMGEIECRLLLTRVANTVEPKLKRALAAAKSATTNAQNCSAGRGMIASQEEIKRSISACSSHGFVREIIKGANDAIGHVRSEMRGMGC